MILTYLLRLHLQVGAIALDHRGRGIVPVGFSEDFSSLPDLSIMRALDKSWLQRAKKILYCDNLWYILVYATWNVQFPFFTHWHPEDLRLLPRVRLVLQSGNNFTYWRREPAGELFLRLQQVWWDSQSEYHLSPGAMDLWSYRWISLADVSGPLGDDSFSYTLPDPHEDVETLQEQFPLSEFSCTAPRRILKRPAQAQRITFCEETRFALERRLRQFCDSSVRVSLHHT